MAFNRKQKLRDNIEAVRTAFTLDRERRTPTERERALLERYCGFGGLKCILNPARELADAVHWVKSDLELFAPTVELHRIIRENSWDETEYKRYVDSLKASVLTAFYTPQAITDTIVDVLHDKKVRPKRSIRRKPSRTPSWMCCMTRKCARSSCWSLRRAWARSSARCCRTIRRRMSWLSRKTC